MKKERKFTNSKYQSFIDGNIPSVVNVYDVNLQKIIIRIIVIIVQFCTYIRNFSESQVLYIFIYSL